MLVPCNVNDANLVACRLTACMTLKPGTSVDHACVTLPDPSPAVTTARFDPCTLCPSLHLTDVSETQSVASHPVCPCRARNVYAILPMLAPCNVTEANLVACRLTACMTLKPGTSVDHACVTLPDRSADVTTARLDPRTLCASLQLTDVSETQSVASHPVCPCRARNVYAILPMLASCTVTKINPVACRLTTCMTLKPGTSVDHACVTLPDRSTAVTTTCLDPCTPYLSLQLTDVSETQSVASHPVCPCRARPVYAILPMLAPCTVTEANAVACRLTACMTLKPGTSVDHACVTLPDLSTAVTTASLDPCMLCPSLHLTEMSETHSVASHPVCPCRARNVYAILPMLAPCTVTKANAVACRLTTCMTLKPGTSVDHACVTLPDSSPAVTTALLVP